VLRAILTSDGHPKEILLATPLMHLVCVPDECSCVFVFGKPSNPTSKLPFEWVTEGGMYNYEDHSRTSGGGKGFEESEAGHSMLVT
jgi:hypothetical protein